MSQIIIVGAGQAGAACAAKLRALKFDGAITLIGDENAPPYQRPPLSKAYLMQQIGAERLWLRNDDFWAKNNILLRLGTPVTGIDAAARTLRLGDKTLPYDDLVLTTGATPRQLPAAQGGALAGVHALRNLADVDRMRAECVAGAKLVVIGGGYIGLEAAAVARKLGLDVTVVEMAPRILQRVASAETAGFVRALHESHGVKILEATRISHLVGQDRVSGVALADGRVLPADVVIVGIGVDPQTALAEQAGARIDNGIATDAQGRTSVPGIWAAGDCASFPLAGRQYRLESVGNAIDQAELVAANILGAGRDYQPKPWFWSDQYDCKLQIAGLNRGYDRVVTRQADGKTSFWYYAGDRLLAMDAISDPRAYMIAKRLIDNGRSADANVVADPDADLKALLA